MCVLSLPVLYLGGRFQVDLRRSHLVVLIVMVTAQNFKFEKDSYTFALHHLFATISWNRALSVWEILGKKIKTALLSDFLVWVFRIFIFESLKWQHSSQKLHKYVSCFFKFQRRLWCEILKNTWYTESSLELNLYNNFEICLD
jgi:hypothetical protein